MSWGRDDLHWLEARAPASSCISSHRLALITIDWKDAGVEVQQRVLLHSEKARMTWRTVCVDMKSHSHVYASRRPIARREGLVGGGGHRHYGCVYVMNSICNWDSGTKPPTTADPRWRCAQLKLYGTNWFSGWTMAVAWENAYFIALRWEYGHVLLNFK